MSGGKTANENGKAAEDMVEEVIHKHARLPIKPYRKWGGEYGVVLKNAPYTNIYGSNRSRSEFLIIDSNGREMRIEVKWQQVAGSVDEKFPFVLFNALEVPEPLVVVVVDGGGAKPTAVEWLKEQARLHKSNTKEVLVFDLDEFEEWFASRVSRNVSL